MKTSGPMTPTRIAATSPRLSMAAGLVTGAFMASEGNVDDLDCRVLLEAIDVEFDADARTFYATEGRHGVQCAVLIHPRRSAFQLAGVASRFLRIVTPNRSAKPYLERIGAFDSFLDR